MLREFILGNQQEIIRRTRKKVASRTSPSPTEAELNHGVPLFIKQLCGALILEEDHDPTSASLNISIAESDAAIAATATLHGSELVQMGFTVGQVVHDYGDVCQAVTELAVEYKVDISTEDFRTLNRCLDDAIALAVSEFSRQREQGIIDEGTQRAGRLAHELRNGISSSLLCYSSLVKGSVGINGATGSLLGRCLAGLSETIDCSLAEVRMEAGVHHVTHINVAHLVDDVATLAEISATLRGLTLGVGRVDNALSIEGDRQLIASALTNLLQNACKFSHKNGHVALNTSTPRENAVFFEITDECGGLKPGQAESIFRPYAQGDKDRTGLGLGLAITQRAVTYWGGTLGVRSIAGKGCVFSIDIPRKAPQ